jgi:hypothetical protein
MVAVVERLVVERLVVERLVVECLVVERLVVERLVVERLVVECLVVERLAVERLVVSSLIGNVTAMATLDGAIALPLAAAACLYAAARLRPGIRHQFILTTVFRVRARHVTSLSWSAASDATFEDRSREGHIVVVVLDRLRELARPHKSAGAVPVTPSLTTDAALLRTLVVDTRELVQGLVQDRHRSFRERLHQQSPRLPRIRSAREKFKTFSDEKPSGRLCCGTSWIQFTVVASAPPESQGATASLGKAW